MTSREIPKYIEPEDLFKRLDGVQTQYLFEKDEATLADALVDLDSQFRLMTDESKSRQRKEYGYAVSLYNDLARNVYSRLDQAKARRFVW